MPDSNAFPYKFTYGDPGMFLEIYVPTIYIPALRVDLDRGMNIAHLKKYLLDNVGEIRQLLADHDEFATLSETRIKSVKKGLEGYSIYCGDGAFEYKGAALHDDVSVVRLAFWAPLDEVNPKESRFAARRYLRFWTHDQKKYLTMRGEADTGLRDFDEVSYLASLKAWLDDIALVVNGYVIHALCKESKRKADAQEVRHQEYEIWVSSYRCVALNKVKLATETSVEHG